MDERNIHSSSSNGLIIAVLCLIGIGTVFLLQIAGVVDTEGAWLLYILIPGLLFLIQGALSYRDHKKQYAINMLWVGAMVSYLAIAFFMQVPLMAIWPVLLVITVIYIIANLVLRPTSIDG